MNGLRGRPDRSAGATSTVFEHGRSPALPSVPENSTARIDAEHKWSAEEGRVVGKGRAFEGKSRQQYDIISGAETDNVFRDKPWNAPSVQALSKQVGKSKDTRPLLIEGMTGDVISSVGCDADNMVASAALRESRGNKTGRETMRLEKQKAVFGAVYEHRDCFGKPRYIGATDDAPENSYREDVAGHQAVKNLITHQAGRSEVVWVGKSAAMNSADMQNITKHIIDKRSADMQAEKLKGPKPYSRHGY